MSLLKIGLKILTTFALLSLFSCESSNENKIPMPEDLAVSKDLSPDESIAISRFWTADEAYKIKRFVERNDWQAIQSESGLYCAVYKKQPNARQAKAGDVAVVEYKVRLINADTTLCYASEEGKPQEILIDMDNVETGLHEALTYLREGESAYVVLPHYLAHGLAGDLDKIPPLSAVLYEIDLISLK
jgi:FKBP-type peptidyl-prolyl cis-trans isomerase FkpA